MICRLLSSLWLALLFVQPALAATDARMQILVTPNEEAGITLQSLQTHIAQAADMALPRLWPRIVPQQALINIPSPVAGMRFLQRATPTENGLMISFQARRVFAWLQANNIPYIEQAPAWRVQINLQDEFGRIMTRSGAMLNASAEQMAMDLGYIITPAAPALILDWRWLDSSRVSLSVRGNARLGEYEETRMLASGDPVKQLQPWLQEVLLKARDATLLPDEPVRQAATLLQQPVPMDAGHRTMPTQAGAAAVDDYLLLKVRRHASLPEQILFEQDLRQDPRILDLSLRQVNSDGQQYRLHLKGSDDLWLRDWFSRRGMTLTATIEGWVASQESPAR
ncbi:MAG: hypothetical protein R8K50_06025 [Mariprofundus sp.]